MSQVNTVTVLIFGQEYTLSGDMPREYIMKLADKVDEKMKEVGGDKSQSVSKTAVLAAMLISDELFSKNSESSSAVAELQRLKTIVADSDSRFSDIARDYEDYRNKAEATIQALRETVEQQDRQLQNATAVTPESQRKIEELEARCRDIESSFFDIQMENIHLKNELENYKKRDF